MKLSTAKIKKELQKMEQNYTKHKNYLKRAIKEGNNYNKKCSLRALDLWYKDHMTLCQKISNLVTKYGIDVTY